MSAVPAGVRTTSEVDPECTRLVLVRHGEARCNVAGIVGGVAGCTGLTDVGCEQVEALAARWRSTGEFAGVAALYASVLPRAIETAELLRPALDAWRDGPPLSLVSECALCELHPGESDGLTWAQFAERFPDPDWDRDPTTPLAPGGESWSGFVARASAAVADLAHRHRGQTIVIACHAGVIDATLLKFLHVDPSVPRPRLRTAHASVTAWEVTGERWLLDRYNDRAVQQA